MLGKHPYVQNFNRIKKFENNGKQKRSIENIDAENSTDCKIIKLEVPESRDNPKSEENVTKTDSEKIPELVSHDELNLQKYAEKLERLKNVQEKWMAETDEWRAKYINHDDYGPEHPEEQKYQNMKRKLESKISKVQCKYDDLLHK